VKQRRTLLRERENKKIFLIILYLFFIFMRRYVKQKWKDDNFECGHFETSISKAAGCPLQGLVTPWAPVRVRVVDGKVGQVRLG